MPNLCVFSIRFGVLTKCRLIFLAVDARVQWYSDFKAQTEGKKVDIAFLQEKKKELIQESNANTVALDEWKTHFREYALKEYGKPSLTRFEVEGDSQAQAILREVSAREWNSAALDVQRDVVANRLQRELTSSISHLDIGAIQKSQEALKHQLRKGADLWVEAEAKLDGGWSAEEKLAARNEAHADIDRTVQDSVQAELCKRLKAYEQSQERRVALEKAERERLDKVVMREQAAQLAATTLNPEECNFDDIRVARNARVEYLLAVQERQNLLEGMNKEPLPTTALDRNEHLIEESRRIMHQTYQTIDIDPQIEQERHSQRHRIGM